MSTLSEAIITRLGQAKRDGIHLQMGDVKRIIEEEEAKLKPVKAKRLSDMTDEEWENCRQRNIDHLNLMLAKDFWTDQDLSPLQDAVA